MTLQRTAKEWQQLADEMRPKVRYWVPGAAMDDNDLIEELHALHNRGYGGVELVPLMATPEEIVHSEDGWNTPHWNHVLSVVNETCLELGMSMDVANGPRWPISMPCIESTDDPAAITELTYGVIDLGEASSYHGFLPERRVRHEEGTPEPVAVMAYQQNVEGRLVRASYTDLMSGLVRDADGTDSLQVQLEAPGAGCHWLIFAFYVQPTVHKTVEGTYYVVDHLSKAGVEACEAYWGPLFEDLEGLASMESLFCDSLEYETCLDWTRNLPEEFEARRGYSILPYLPFIGYKETFPESDPPGYQLDEIEISDMAAQDYYETLTQCYCEYHLQGLEDMAERYGKTIRYQVAYNKQFDEERCPLYVAIPENEALGRPSMDGLSTMAAAAHLGRKKRYSFECAAEAGNCYGQSYEDLFWWIKRGYMSGMNAQVIHGAAYSGAYHGVCAAEDGFMEGVQWPGYEAFMRLVSNNWNRTLSIPDARGCIDTITRMNTIFRQKARVDCAIYRASYLNAGTDSEFAYFDDDGRLDNAGYSYETISAALLAHPNCKVQNAVLDADGAAYQCLLIPPQQTASVGLLRQVDEMLEHQFPVIWFGEKPEHAQFYAEWRTEERKESWQQLMDAVWEHPELVHAQDVHEAVPVLKHLGVRPRAELAGTMDIVTAVRDGDHARYFAFYGYNRVLYTPDDPNPDELSVSAIFQHGTTKSTYQRPGSGSRKEVQVSLAAKGQVYLMNPWSGQERPLDFIERDGRMEGVISIEEDELVMLAVRADERMITVQTEALVQTIPARFETVEFEVFGPQTPGEKSFLRSGYAGGSLRVRIDGLKSWYEMDPSMETFAGRGTYRGRLIMDQVDESSRYVLCLGDVCDTFSVKVNGTGTAFPDQVQKEVEVTGLLHEGENKLEVCVVSNLFNRLMKDTAGQDLPFQLPYTPKKYGIWESEGKRCELKVFR